MERRMEREGGVESERPGQGQRSDGHSKINRGYRRVQRKDRLRDGVQIDWKHKCWYEANLKVVEEERAGGQEYRDPESANQSRRGGQKGNSERGRSRDRERRR